MPSRSTAVRGPFWSPIAWHRPGNPIGWLILTGVDIQGLAIAGALYVTLASRPGYHLPVGPLVWLDSAWFLGIAVVHVDLDELGAQALNLLFDDRPGGERLDARLAEIDELLQTHRALGAVGAFEP